MVMDFKTRAYDFDRYSAGGWDTAHGTYYGSVVMHRGTDTCVRPYFNQFPDWYDQCFAFPNGIVGQDGSATTQLWGITKDGVATTFTVSTSTISTCSLTTCTVVGPFKIDDTSGVLKPKIKTGAFTGEEEEVWLENRGGGDVRWCFYDGTTVFETTMDTR